MNKGVKIIWIAHSFNYLDWDHIVSSSIKGMNLLHKHPSSILYLVWPMSTAGKSLLIHAPLGLSSNTLLSLWIKPSSITWSLDCLSLAWKYLPPILLKSLFLGDEEWKKRKKLFLSCSLSVSIQYKIMNAPES